MAYVQADRVQETTTTTGTGTVTLAGAVAGYRTFGSQMANGDTCYYVIFDPATNAWETGIGTYSSSTLARTTMLDSSTGSVVSFGAGTKNVLMAPVAKGALLKTDTVTCQGGAGTAATLWGDITSGSITIGGGLTTGDLRLGASGQSGAVIVQSNQLYFGGANLQQMIFTGGATNHALELGRQDGTASTPYIDFHTGTTPVDYDVRMLASGASGSSGGGDLTLYLASLILNGTLKPLAGTTSKAPISLAAGTNKTTPAAGDVEFDGQLLYLTPNTSIGREAVGASMWYRLTSSVSLTSGTSVQSLFNVGATLPIGTYLIEMYVGLATGTTSHTVAIGLGGTATWSAPIRYAEFLNVASAGTPTSPVAFWSQGTLTSGTPEVISPASTVATKFFKWTTTLSVSAAGTVIPQVKFSAAPGGTNQTRANSWIRITPMDNAVGAWA
jgi:hypothetical protein